MYNVLAIDFEGVCIRKGEPVLIHDENDGCLLLKDVELLQFSGIYDRYNKEIYESDIVHNHGIDNAGVVKLGRFIQKQFMKHDRPYWYEGFYVERGIETNSLLGMKWVYNGVNITESENTLEIIGNTFENPELVNQS